MSPLTPSYYPDLRASTPAWPGRRVAVAAALATAALGLWPAAAQANGLPDMAAGKKKAAVCFACHGENGVSAVTQYPHLAGQHREYLEKALRDYREQRRQDPTMNAMAQSLGDADIRNIAAYYSSLPPARR